jgi:oligoribonuclease (3'-5' exoribonuclease)
MPELESWLRYYSIDVGVLRRTLQIVGRTDLLLAAPGKGHRAMSDVLLHLDELRHLKAALRKEATL